MALHCGSCYGTDTAPLADSFQCFDCGATTTYEAVVGSVPEPGLTTSKKKK